MSQHVNHQAREKERWLINAAPDLLKVAEAYEAWEADLIMSDESWAPCGMASTPKITEEQWERLIEIQAMRNAAIRKAKGCGE